MFETDTPGVSVGYVRSCSLCRRISGIERKALEGGAGG
jgi:hypothetical protein